MESIKKIEDEVWARIENEESFHKNSNQVYDEGFGGEAIRIATTMRVLFHNTDLTGWKSKII